MYKSKVIPKFCVSAVLLIITLVIMIPTLPVMMNKLSGTLDFNTAAAVQLGNNRCIEGTLKQVLGGTETENEGSTLSNTEYYYLTTLGGKEINKDEKTQVIFLKSNSASDTNEMLKELASKPKETEFSGIVKTAPENADEMFAEVCGSKGLDTSKLELCDYVIDVTTTPKAVTLRFVVSVAFAAAFGIALSISLSAVKRNNEVDYMYHEREMMRAKQSVREGADQPDGSDGLFSSDTRDFTQNSQGSPQNTFDPTQYTGVRNTNESDFDDGGFFGG